MRLNVAHKLPRSAVNGPGERFVLWVQGCGLACPGCWNPDTWSFERRNVRDVRDLADEILATEGIQGVTFSGGEPFSQAASLANLAELVRERGLSVFIFTGYELEELQGPAQRKLLAAADVVVAGRYVREERADGLPWRGSANQRVHFLTDRYDEADMTTAPEVEVRIGPDGTISMTGFPVGIRISHPGSDLFHKADDPTA